MKYIIALALSLLTVAGWATPVVGESATFAVIINENNAGIIKYELVAYNAETHMFAYTTTSTLSGVAQETTEWTDTELYLSTGTVDQLLATCQTPETLQTEAGAIATCKLVSEGAPGNTGYVWVGRVPFGIVKSEMTYASSNGNNLHLVTLLKAFKLGAP